MGTKRDVEVANLLARQAEMKARRDASPALSSEWRWSLTGWGGWSAERAPDLDTPPESDLASPDDKRKD